MHSTRPELSVVIPIYEEEANLRELYRRLVLTLDPVEKPYELIFVNDGSKDASPALLDGLHESDGRVVVVHLSRNFGHQAALSAGIDQARGQAVILMDGDLQDPPEVLPRFIETWQRGYEVVYAVRTRRKESLFKRGAYALFYRLLRAGSDLDIPLDSGDFCLLDRKAVRALRRLPERQRFLRGLRAFVGFRQAGVSFEREARHAGRPKYSLAALFRLALDGFFGFSRWPLRVVTTAGIFALMAALALGTWLAAAAIGTQAAPPDWTISVFAIALLGSVQLLSLGIVGEYVRRIFLEVKQRPGYVVSEIRRAAPAQARRKRRSRSRLVA